MGFTSTRESTMLTKPIMNRLVLKGLQSRCMSTGGKTSALIIGAPGSGKGTISNWIVRDFGLVHVSSGDLLRAHLRDGTPLGLEAKSYIAAGDLVPDKVMVGLVSSELKKLGSQPWLLDGFPRTQPQAESLQAETPQCCGQSLRAFRDHHRQDQGQMDPPWLWQSLQ